MKNLLLIVVVFLCGLIARSEDTAVVYNSIFDSPNYYMVGTITISDFSIEFKYILLQRTFIDSLKYLEIARRFRLQNELNKIAAYRAISDKIFKSSVFNSQNHNYGDYTEARYGRKYPAINSNWLGFNINL